MKQQVTIEVDIPEGYEATGEFRGVNPGDGFYLDDFGAAVPRTNDISLGTRKRLILKKKWVWPAWLTAHCIAMDADGNWYAYENDADWSHFTLAWAVSSRCAVLTSDLFDMELPPTPERPEDSKIVNPKYRQKETI